MLISSWCDNLLLVSVILVPVFFFGGAPHSFLYYAKKSQASPEVIEVFKEKLGFPFRMLFTGSIRQMLWSTYGKNKDLIEEIRTSRFEDIRYQRVIIYSCHLVLVVLLMLGSLSQNAIFLKCVGLFSTLALSFIIYACWRFGHSLQESPHGV